MSNAKNPHAVALGRKGGLAAAGRSGRKAKPTKCPRCKALCASAVAAKYHYRECAKPV